MNKPIDKYLAEIREYNDKLKADIKGLDKFFTDSDQYKQLNKEEKAKFKNLYMIASERLNKIADSAEHVKAESHLLRGLLNEYTSKLEEAQRLANIGNWEWNIKKDEIKWSKELYRIYGIDQQAGEMDYDNFIRHIHPDDRELVDSTVQQALKTGNSYSFYHKIVREDGQVRVLHGRGAVEHNEKGEPVRMYGTAQDITLRAHYEEMIRKSEKKYKTVVETMGEGLTIINKSGVVQFVNPSFLKMIKYKESDLIGQKITRFYTSKKFVYLVRSRLRKCYRGLSVEYNVQITTGNNEKRWLGVSAAPLYNEDGKIDGTIRVYRNISNLKYSRDLLYNTIESSTISMILVNKERKVIMCNSATEKLFGYSKSELINSSVEKLIPERFQVKNTSKWQDYFESLKTIIFRAGRDLFGVKKNGDEVPVQVGLTPIGPDDDLKVLATVVDMTEHKQYEEQLDSLARFPEENPDPIIRYELSKQQIIYANNAARKATHLIEDKDVFGILKKTFNKSYELNTRKTKEIQLKNNQIYQCAIVPFPKHGYVNMYASNITDKKNAEREMLKSKKMAEESAKAKEIFLANMSHEIRTPMNAIVGIVQLLEETSLNDQQKDYLRYMNFASENLLRIINDVLDIARIESGKLKIESVQFNLREIINEIENVISSLLKEKNIAFNIEWASSVPAMLIGDPVRLNQILLNLLNNSVKFTAKGHIKLRIQKKPGKDKSKVNIIFEVEDTGIGIPKDKQNAIFNAFEQAHKGTERKYEGTGLGLSIVKNLLDLQGGKIAFWSKEGKGSLFKVELPYRIGKPVKKTALTQPSASAVSQLTNKKILLVEDNHLNQMVARKMLKSIGMKISVANNGVEAIEKLKKHKFDIVLMDIHMPEMDGYEATRYLRKELKIIKTDLPVIAMTARVMKGEQERCIKAGMNAYISKPIKLLQLKQVLLSHIKNGRLSRKVVRNKSKK